jgi:hypothetical protein
MDAGSNWSVMAIEMVISIVSYNTCPCPAHPQCAHMHDHARKYRERGNTVGQEQIEGLSDSKEMPSPATLCPSLLNTSMLDTTTQNLQHQKPSSMHIVISLTKRLTKSSLKLILAQ